MISEWMKVMLEEISRKRAESEQARIEEQRRTEEQQRPASRAGCDRVDSVRPPER